MAHFSTRAAAPVLCPHCRAAIAPGLLSCPACRGLVHAAALKTLAAQADEHERSGRPTDALASWRQALELLPPASNQYAVVMEKVTTLSRQVDAFAPSPPKPKTDANTWKKTAGVVGVTLLFLWKFKAIALILLSKAKLLLLGLTKVSTVFSMLLSAGVYWTLWGWKFALGLVLSIYVHEMGHVAALRRLGIKASAPMFIPGFGAMVRLKQYPADAREDARIGLAGPIWGLGAALASYLAFRATGWGSWAAIAQLGAWINLFNLLPVWQLDGARGFRALTRLQRSMVAAAMGGLWLATGEGLLALLCIVAVVRCFMKDAPAEGDQRALLEFVGLLIALSLLSTIDVPIPAAAPAEPPALVQ